MPETVAFFAGLASQLILTHLNHTNPLLDLDSPEQSSIKNRGAAVAYTGQVIDL